MKNIILKMFPFIVLCLFIGGISELQAQPNCESQKVIHSYQVRRYAPLSGERFDILFSKIKKKSFDDDKLEIIEVASLGCRYTCSQCVKILQLFPFDSEKLKALQFLAPQIVDERNNYDIIKVFTFDSDKEKAARILQNRNCK